MDEAFLSDQARLARLKRVETPMKICDYIAAIIGVSGVLIMAPEVYSTRFLCLTISPYLAIELSILR